MVSELSKDELKLYLDYNEITGEFIRKIKTNNYIKIWDIAGCFHKGSGYILIMVKGKTYPAHHLAWLYHYGYLPKEIDHINGIRSDNRIENLREVSRQENCRNQKKYNTNTSGVTGVCYHKRDKLWGAYIAVNNEQIHLGYFKDISDAISIRKKAEIKYGFHHNHGRN